MRVKPEIIEQIKKSVFKLDPDAQIFLFGSRVDDTKKGGDIDVLIISKKLSPVHSIDIRVDLFGHIEEQRIDIVIKNDKKSPFVRMVLPNAVVV